MFFFRFRMNFNEFTRRLIGVFLVISFFVCADYLLSTFKRDEFTPVKYYKKPENFEETCKLDKNCEEDCDVCCELPYHIDTGALI